ncbi:MAG: hypothetical protein QHH00_01265 [Methanomassiliicoccales archaeon]|nr:hypothetical protein [Methanomassiliicoccales archaeon]
MGDQDISYDRTVVKILQHISKIKSSYCSAFASFNPDRRCASCHSNPWSVFDHVIDQLSIKDLRLHLNSQLINRSEKCQDCSERLEFWLKCASAEIEAIERIVARELFKVVITDGECRYQTF